MTEKTVNWFLNIPSHSTKISNLQVTRNEEGTIKTSLYRKETFSGLYMKFDSFVPLHFKNNLISGLLNRAWKICSSYELFYMELKL